MWHRVGSQCRVAKCPKLVYVVIETLDDQSISMSTYMVVQALIISRLDYCNSVLTGLPDANLQPLTKVLHTADQLVKDLRPRDHTTQPLKHLHWLPIRARISFKINLLN